MSKNKARKGKKNRSKRPSQAKQNKTSQNNNSINEEIRSETIEQETNEETIHIEELTEIQQERDDLNDTASESEDIEPAEEQKMAEEAVPADETASEDKQQPVESDADEGPEQGTVEEEQPVPEEADEKEQDVPTDDPEPKKDMFFESAVPAQTVKVKKPHTGIKAFIVLVLILAYCAAVIYGIFQVEKTIVSPEKFHQGTFINDVDVSGMDIPEARQALTEKWNRGSISILNSTGSRIGEIKDFDFRYDIDDSLDSIMKPGAEKAILHYIKKDKLDYTIQMKPDESTDSFDKQFNDLSIVKEAEGDKPSKNAYIDKSDTEFRIVKEVYGNSVDTDMLKKAIFESIARGENTFQFRRDSFHKAPDIVSNSPELLEERDYCRKYLSFKLRYRNSVNDYTVTPEWLDKMMKVTDMGKVKINEENVDDFINNVLYPKFSSIGDTRKLKSAGGGTYTISGGTYGFTIDTKKEENLLKAELKEREDVEREPNYSGKKPTKNGASDIGDDFVEVSIAKQRVWVVKNGKTVVDTSVVTGNVPRHNTPTGVYYIVYKATNTVLKGHNDDGSEYESHVAYWMPFYLGYGLHDASWRGVFGGSIYLGNGSHGCVNCPPSVMPKIFKSCYTGMPVIVH